ncbi:MAG: radical SAM protein [Thermoplasmatota archaeon]
MSVASYVKLFRSGELERRRDLALEMMVDCRLCPRKCGVDRLKDEKGFCRIGRYAVVSSCGPHFGEEGPLVGRNGSGTIFFSGCNLGCRFCQNWDISQKVTGEVADAERLASLMMRVQGFGCHNLNLVSPTHVVPQVLEALEIACMRGFELPIVYNTGGYDPLEVLRVLEGIVDIYMPDMKYSDPSVGRRLSRVEKYPEVNFAAIREMHRQVGDLIMDERGVAEKGLLVRHLVLPNDLAGTEKIARFLSDEVSKDTYINVMGQYRPEYKAMECEGMGRRPSRDEYLRAVKLVLDSGLHRLDRVVL